MINTQTIQLLKMLSIRELKTFEAYLHSPIFNKNKQLISLFNILKKSHPSFEKYKITKFKISNKLFPTKTDKAKDVALRKLSSQLAAMIKDFLVFQVHQQRVFNKEVALIQIFARRKQTKMMYTQLTKLESKEEIIKDVGFYFNKFLLDNVKYETKKSIGKQLDISNLVSVFENIDIFYIVQKLQYCCTFLSKHKLEDLDTKVLFLREIIQLLEKESFLKEVPLINIYYTTIQLYKTQSEIYFFKLKELLKTQTKHLLKYETNSLYKLLLNYCIHQLKQGNTSYNQYTFEVYQEMLSKDLLILEGYLLPADFKNITTIAAKVQQFNWATNFIETYKEKLPPEHQENMTHYTKGILAFYQKNHAKVLAHLTQVEHINFVYHLNTESLLIKTYYEVKQWQALESKLGAFRKYVERNTMMSESNKQAYYDFVKLSKRLFHWREKLDFAKQDTKTANSIINGLEKLQTDITTCQPLVNKKWLSEKANLEQQKFTTIKTEQTN